MKAICSIVSCPAHRAVRGGAPQPSTAGPFRRSLVRSVRNPVLPDHVVEKAEEARALDGAREFTLLLGRDRRDAARHDLAALRDVALQQLHVLVVDLRRVRAGERAGLAPAEEGTAAASGC